MNSLNLSKVKKTLKEVRNVSYCAVCNDKTNFLERRNISDKQVVCVDCFQKASQNLPVKNLFKSNELTAEEIRDAIKKSDDRGIESYDFDPSKNIGDIIAFDDKRKLLAISPKVKARIYKYDAINEFELLEDGETVSSGGLGRALIGGALFGGTGAIVGGITGKRKRKSKISSLRIKLSLNNIDTPIDYIDFLDKKTKKGSSVYKEAYENAQECLSILDMICKGRGKDKSESPISVTDEIIKFKELLDAGAITDEEYNKKKQELLDLD